MNNIYVSKAEPARLLSNDLYITYLTNDEKHVTKLYTEYSDDNNEYEIMTILYNHGVIDARPNMLLTSADIEKFGLYTDMDEKIVKAIRYEFIPGEVLTIFTRASYVEKTRWRKQLTRQLTQIHDMGFIYGDKMIDNVVITKTGRATLIDFGRTFHDSDSNFPPMGYMLEYDERPTFVDDWKELERLFESM
jgi:serine/threonine protein kinase